MSRLLAAPFVIAAEVAYEVARLLELAGMSFTDRRGA